MHWDSGGNALYIYDTSAGWEKVWGDTGWVNITVNVGFAAGGSAPQYRMIGDIVYLRGTFTSAGMTAGASAACGQLPAVAYPTQTLVYANATSATSASVNKVAISSAGVLSITPAVASGSHFINFSYPIG
jgi:hypothetical protein